MTTTELTVRPQAPAMLKNVSAFLLLADRLRSRPPGLSGFGCFSGYSGLGKTMAAQHAQNTRGALYLEVREWWTRKVFLEMLLAELGVLTPPPTIAKMMMRIISILSEDRGQLLIVDEADKLVDKGMIELVRGLQGDTDIPILLVGEELLPQKLRSVERMFNRVLEWELAQPADLTDAKLLAGKWCPGVQIADELLEQMISRAGGNARKIAATLNMARGFSVNAGIAALTSANYAGGFFTGEPLLRGRR
jgi:DNA transposition AAA+ family ATPase